MRGDLRSSAHWVRAASALAVAVLSCAARPAFAQDEEPELSETECALPHFEGKLVTSVWPERCGAVECTTSATAALQTEDGDELFAVRADRGDSPSEPPELACESDRLVVRWLGQTLHFEFHAGALRLSFTDRRRAATLWQAPVARTPEALAAHESFRAVLDLVLDGIADSQAPMPLGLDEELWQIADLVVLRDHVRSGDFEYASQSLRRLEETQAHAPPKRSSPARGFVAFRSPRNEPPPLPPALFAHAVELRRELDASRRRTMPFTLGPRRFVGGAARLLRGPLGLIDPPELFFRGSKLCVSELGPRSPRDASPVSTGRMRCFAPDATTPSEAEPLVLPASSADHLAYSDFTSMYNRCRASLTLRQKSTPPGANVCDGGPGIASQDLLAVVDGDAMLALADGGLELVRGPDEVEKLSPAEARALVARSAGTMLYARTASYFLERGRVVQVAGSESKTWDVLGAPPEGAYWLGAPLVSPDQRWVVAQSGNGGGPVSLWVFPIR